MEEVYACLRRFDAIMEEWKHDEQQLEQLLSKKYPGMSNEDMMAEYNRLRFSHTPLSIEDEQRRSELQAVLQALGWIRSEQ